MHLRMLWHCEYSSLSSHHHQHNHHHHHHHHHHLHMKLPYSTTSHHHHCKLLLFSSFLNIFQPSPSSSTRVNHLHIHRKKPSTTTATTAADISTATATVSAAVDRRRRRKIVVIMGATGAGKSRLSIDLATRFFKNSEIINSDKMQVYRGLDITTNKITMQEQCGVPHHLLGVIDPTESVFTPSDYRNLVPEIISDVKRRRNLPLIVGGSNSLIYSLVTKQYDPKSNVFSGSDPVPITSELRYDCCFIWVDVSSPVLNRYLSDRVDRMMDSGMFNELVDFFRCGEHKRVKSSGLGRAIGLPEFEGYFGKYPGFRRPYGGGSSEGMAEEYDEAVRMIKDNTCQLAKRQVGKILRLRDAGWELKRVDATEAFTAVMMAEYGGGRVAEIWDEQVVQPSVKILKRFLEE